MSVWDRLGRLRHVLFDHIHWGRPFDPVPPARDVGGMPWGDDDE